MKTIIKNKADWMNKTYSLLLLFYACHDDDDECSSSSTKEEGKNKKKIIIINNNQWCVTMLQPKLLINQPKTLSAP